MRLGIAALARARDAALGVHDHETLRPAGTHGRGRGARGGRGVAAGAGHESGLALLAKDAGSPEVVGKELGQAKGACSEKLGRGVRGPVPLLVDLGVGEAVVGREVNDGDPGIEQARHLGERGGMGHGEEHEVAGLDHGVVVRGEREIRGTGEGRVGLGERGARVGVGRDGDELELRVLDEQADELRPGVACGADDPNLV